MAKRALGAKTSQLPSSRLLSVRFPADILRHIKVAMVRGGYSSRKRSQWIREAVSHLAVMAGEQREEFLAAVEHYVTEGAEKGIQITLSDGALRDFETLLASAKRGGFAEEGLRTRLLFMACHLRLLDEGVIS